MKQRILAIDDEPHMLSLLERIITEKTPFQIETTNSSLEVPRILEENQFDLIILDLKMPGMDGMDILRHINKHKRQEEVIIITAFGSLESAEGLLEQGIFDYMSKPFKKEKFLLTVYRAMRLQKMKKEAEHLAAIFDTEPYENARKLFNEEYLARLAERYGYDEQAMTEQSGLSEKNITAFIKNDSKDD